jgi:hypothetical protein
MLGRIAQLMKHCLYLLPVSVVNLIPTFQGNLVSSSPSFHNSQNLLMQHHIPGDHNPWQAPETPTNSPTKLNLKKKSPVVDDSNF